MVAYGLKITSMIFILTTFFACSKSPSGNDDENDIVEPEIMYISKSFMPPYKNSITLIDANGNSRRQIYSTTRSMWDPNFSPDGKSIIFVMEEEIGAIVGSAIYRIDVKGKNLVKISINYFNDYDFACKYPQFLPDGIHIVYSASVTLGDYQIRILNTETKEDRLLAVCFPFRVKPAISGDGQWIVYWDDGDLHRIHFTGGESYKITNGNAESEEFDLNKMTNEIMFLSLDPQSPYVSKLAKIKLDGSNYIEYNFSGARPKISNDGAHILFIANGNNKVSIWISDADGSNARIVTSHDTADYFAQFFPADDKILIVRGVTDLALYSCGLNGEDLKQLTPLDYLPWHCPQFRP